MSATERLKGARAEREVAEIFRAHGLAAAQRAAGGTVQLSGDVIGIPKTVVSVKRHEVLRIPSWIREANALGLDSNAMPVLAYRTSVHGVCPYWRGDLPLTDLAELLATRQQWVRV